MYHNHLFSFLSVLWFNLFLWYNLIWPLCDVFVAWDVCVTCDNFPFWNQQGLITWPLMKHANVFSESCGLNLRDSAWFIPPNLKSCSAIILNNGALQECVLGPLLYSSYTHECAAKYSIYKFTDDTFVVGWILNNDGMDYRNEIGNRETWCQGNNLPCRPRQRKLWFTSGSKAVHITQYTLTELK